MEAMAGEPHVAGQPSSKKVADYALAKFKSFGLDAKLEEFEAMMPWPIETSVELVAPEKYTLRVKEPVLAEDPDSGDQTPLYNAYSGDGNVTGEVVYVNYGMPADYDKLKELGVDVKGKIVIARYGAGWRGIKPKVALRARRHRLPDLFRSERRRLLRGRCVSGRTVSAGVRRAARQRDGHADSRRRSADAGLGQRSRRQEESASRIRRRSSRFRCCRFPMATPRRFFGSSRARSCRTNGRARCRSRITSVPAPRRCT